MHVLSIRSLIILFLFCLPFWGGCTKPSTEGQAGGVGFIADAPGGNGEGIYGQKEPKALINFKNARMQCVVQTLNGVGEHKLHCNAVYLDAKGKPIPGDGIETGTKLSWDELKAIDGTKMKSKNCWVEREGLDLFCDIAIFEGTVTKVLATMQILLEASDQKRPESVVTLIPFVVTSFGEVPEVAFKVGEETVSVSSSGLLDGLAPAATTIPSPVAELEAEEKFEVIQLDPLKTFFPEPLSGCARRNDEMYFTSRNSIFLMKEGKVELYAGSPSDLKAGSLTDRRRINFGSSLHIACNDDAVYVSDTQKARIFRLADVGPVTLVAGNGKQGFSGDGGMAPEAQLNAPTAILLGAEKSLLFIDSGNNRIRKISAEGVITTIAGNGMTGSSGDGGAAIDASFTRLTSMLQSADGGLIVADWGANSIRKINSQGLIESFVAGAPTPYGLSYDKSGSLIMSSTGVRALYPIAQGQPLTGFPYRFMNYPAVPNLGLKTLYPMNPVHLFMNQAKALVMLDFGNNLIKRYPVAQHGEADVIVGTNQAVNPTLEETEAGKIRLRSEGSVAMGKDGSLYMADVPGHRVIRIGPDNKVTNVAGKGKMEWDSYGQKWFGVSPDGVQARDAYIFSPSALTVDDNDNVYVVDQGNYRIRKIDSNGVLTTVAGNGANAFNGWEIYSPETIAKQEPIRRIGGLAVAPNGTLYFSDIDTHLIHKVTPAGLKSKVAGSGVLKKGEASFWVSLFPRAGFSGDNGLAKNAYLSSPRGLAVSGDGTLYIADSGNNRIRRITANGIITTIAGNGLSGYSGDGGPARNARLNHPTSVALMGDGTILVTEPENKRVRKLVPVVAADGSFILDPSGNATYTIHTFIASSESECGTGNVSKKVRDLNVKDAFDKTAARQCVSHPLVVSTTKTCTEKGKSISVGMYQTFGLPGVTESFVDTLSANVVRYTMQCE